MPPRTSKKQSITRERIAEAAIEVAREVGLAGLSLRGVAARLGVTPMALYYHIADKSELDNVVVAHILEQTLHPVKVTARTSWQKILRDIATELYRALGEHPIVLQVFTRFPLHPSCVALTEQAYQALSRAGLTPEECGAAFRLFTGFIVSSTLIQHQLGIDSQAAELEKTMFSSAYAEQFPETVRVASVMNRTRKSRFDHNLDFFIEMIECRTAAAKS